MIKLAFRFRNQFVLLRSRSPILICLSNRGLRGLQHGLRAEAEVWLRKITLAAVCVAGITALTCAQTPEGDEEWEPDLTTAEMGESRLVNVCRFLVHSHPGFEQLMVLSDHGSL